MRSFLTKLFPAFLVTALLISLLFLVPASVPVVNYLFICEFAGCVLALALTTLHCLLFALGEQRIARFLVAVESRIGTDLTNEALVGWNWFFDSANTASCAGLAWPFFNGIAFQLHLGAIIGRECARRFLGKRE